MSLFQIYVYYDRPFSNMATLGFSSLTQCYIGVQAVSNISSETTVPIAMNASLILI